MGLAHKTRDRNVNIHLCLVPLAAFVRYRDIDHRVFRGRKWRWRRPIYMAKRRNLERACFAVHEPRICVLLAEAVCSNFIYQHFLFFSSFVGVFALSGNGRRGPILTKLGGRVEESFLNSMEETACRRGGVLRYPSFHHIWRAGEVANTTIPTLTLTIIPTLTLPLIPTLT